MRAFIGIPLDNKTENFLQSYRKHFKNIKMPAAMHITLKFLGEIKEEKIPGIIKAIERGPEGLERFEISINRISAFPSEKKAAVIWAGIGEGGKKISGIFSRIEAELESEGIKKEKRQFIPHITVARANKPFDISRVKAEMKYPASTMAEKIVLYKSELTQKGAVHTVLYERKL